MSLWNLEHLKFLGLNVLINKNYIFLCQDILLNIDFGPYLILILIL